MTEPRAAADGRWRTSTRSAGNGACVEVASLGAETVVRDSKDPDGPVLRFSLTSWRTFIAAVGVGAFDGVPLA
jgi:hypothetical protein